MLTTSIIIKNSLLLLKISEFKKSFYFCFQKILEIKIKIQYYRLSFK